MTKEERETAQALKKGLGRIDQAQHERSYIGAAIGEPSPVCSSVTSPTSRRRGTARSSTRARRRGDRAHVQPARRRTPRRRVEVRARDGEGHRDRALPHHGGSRKRSLRRAAGVSVRRSCFEPFDVFHAPDKGRRAASRSRSYEDGLGAVGVGARARARASPSPSLGRVALSHGKAHAEVDPEERSSPSTRERSIVSSVTGKARRSRRVSCSSWSTRRASSVIVCARGAHCSRQARQAQGLQASPWSRRHSSPTQDSSRTYPLGEEHDHGKRMDEQRARRRRCRRGRELFTGKKKARSLTQRPTVRTARARASRGTSSAARWAAKANISSATDICRTAFPRTSRADTAQVSRAGPRSLACKADRRSSARWTGATRTCRTVSRPTSPAGLPMAAGDSSRNTRMRRNSSRCKSPCSKSTCSPCRGDHLRGRSVETPVASPSSQVRSLGPPPLVVITDR